MKLECEVCLPGCMDKFEGKKERQKGLGPVQLLGRKEVKGLILSIIRKGL